MRTEQSISAAALLSQTFSGLSGTHNHAGIYSPQAGFIYSPPLRRAVRRGGTDEKCRKILQAFPLLLLALKALILYTKESAAAKRKTCLAPRGLHTAPEEMHLYE